MTFNFFLINKTYSLDISLNDYESIKRVKQNSVVLTVPEPKIQIYPTIGDQ